MEWVNFNDLMEWVNDVMEWVNFNLGCQSLIKINNATSEDPPSFMLKCVHRQVIFSILLSIIGTIQIALWLKFNQ